jgi:hypothetical protein
MNGAPETLARWLERKRRADRVSAAVLAALALGSGTVVFLLASLLMYTVLSVVCGTVVHSIPGLGLAAVALTAWLFTRCAKHRPEARDLGLDPMGYWIVRDIASIGPRLILEGLRQIRCFEQLEELDVPACARALSYLAGKDAAVTWDDLIRHCPSLSPDRLREQLSLLEGVLFLGEHTPRVTLMDPFRLLLRQMLGREDTAGAWHEPARPKSEPPPSDALANEPEKLSAYEILGLSPSASAVEIKAAYRKRIKACHPDLFAGMDPPARAMAERWTKALNAAYATLKPRRQGVRP